MTPETRSTASDVVAKSTLFCPDCDHQGRYDSVWNRVVNGDETHYLCPHCGATVTTRPTAPLEDRCAASKRVPTPGD